MKPKHRFALDLPNAKLLGGIADWLFANPTF
jgi:hypothetical protein